MKRRAYELKIPHYAAVAGMVLLTYLLWDTLATRPVQLYVVFVHECGHAIAALLTGGEVRGMQISENLGGVTSTVGGWPLFILPAGYLAGAIFGGALILAASQPKNARHTLQALAVVTAGCALALVRPLWGFALPFALLAAAAFWLIAAKAPKTAVELVVLYLATVSALYAVIDIKEDLLHPSVHRVTDATMLADRTWIPAIVWGVLFALLALAILGTALHRAIKK